MTGQLSFEEQFEQARISYLPDTLDAAIPFFRDLIDRHHAAMLAGDNVAVQELRREAHDLALRLNGGDAGILAGPDAPGCQLADRTEAPRGTEPKWGQSGWYVIDVDGCKVEIEQDGIFGIGTCGGFFWLSFAAHAVEWDKPFISETGYRSFLGLGADPASGLTPAQFAATVIRAHIDGELTKRPKGKPPIVKLLAIKSDYSERHAKVEA